MRPTPKRAKTTQRQIGINARANEWLLLGRGFHREELDDKGGCVGCGTDEGHLRGMWRHYKDVMSRPPEGLGLAAV